MLYIALALALILIVSTLIFSYQKYHDKRRFVFSLLILVGLSILTYATKILLIYKPLLVVHIALLIMAWYHYYLSLKKRQAWSFWIFAPTLSLMLFVLISLFVRENG